MKYRSLNKKKSHSEPRTTEGNDTALKNPKAVVVALASQKQSIEKTQEYLDELAFLAETNHIEVKHRFIQKLERPDSRTFIGSGKLEEIKTYCIDQAIDLVLFDDDLSPSQIKNIENEIQCRIYDRSLLILEIFLQRAQTAQAKTQVELARYQYLLPRLTHMWTHLERQRGGTGTRGGAGEKEIETDKRVIRDKITLLKEKLDIIDKQSKTRRKSREGVVRVALVGYTNVGKSTLMNLLSQSEVFAENKLFATVDATVRKVVIDRIPFLLSDTVGFIRKLPHTLIESFKSTLDEVREADILVHVIDVSHPGFEEHMEVVKKTLTELDAGTKTIIHVFNKIDEYPLPDEDETDVLGRTSREGILAYLQDSYLTKSTDAEMVFISAKTKENIPALKALLHQKVREKHLLIYPNYLD